MQSICKNGTACIHLSVYNSKIISLPQAAKPSNIGEITKALTCIDLRKTFFKRLLLSCMLAMAGNITAEIVARLGMKKLSKGVRVKVDENTVVIDLSIVLRMNENIVKISNKVQDKVKTTVENMTGLKVENVNVNISSVLSK